MMYVIGVIAVLWFICFFVDIWQASEKTLHYECHRKLFQNGFMDAATGMHGLIVHSRFKSTSWWIYLMFTTTYH